MQFIKQLKTNFFNEQEGRIIFFNEQRQAVLNRFNNVCNNCKCSIIKDKFDIDHIRPLANGGTNKASNLQPLCKACHKDKCMNEHENGEYIKIIDSESSFNNHTQSVMGSPLAETHAFIETIIDEREIFNYDINKCRKNKSYYGDEEYCVLSVFDRVKKYTERDNI